MFCGFFCNIMRFLIILFLIATIHKGIYGKPYLRCSNIVRFKRSPPPLDSNTEANELHPQLHTNILPTNMNNHESNVPAYTNHINEESGYNKSEVVGVPGLARLHALVAQARARAAIQRARIRARIHHPLLLETTPDQLLHEGDKIFQGSESEVASPLLQISSAIPIHNDESGHNRILKPSEHMNFPSSTNTHQHNNLRDIPKTDYQNLLQVRSNQDLQEISNVNSKSIFPKNARYDVYEYENDDDPLLPYSEEQLENLDLPEIQIPNIDDNEETYQNQKPTFSIIPSNWKPPPDSNLYLQGEYQQYNGQDPILAVLPGKWKDNGDDYDTYYYANYDVIPVSYIIPDNYYGRSSQSDREQDSFPKHLVDIKQQLRDWNPKIETSNTETSEILGSAHNHGHGHSHTFSHHHIYGRPYPKGGLIQHQTKYHDSSYGNPTEYSSGYSQNENYGYSSQHVPIHHSSFSHSQNHAVEITPSHGHQLTINKQLTTVVVPPSGHQNVQISQVAGNNNAVSQSQSSHNAHLHEFVNPGFLPESSHNFQSSQINGNINSVSQSQASHGRSVNTESDQLVRSPSIMNFSRFNQRWSDESFHFMRKRSILTQPKEVFAKMSKNVSKILLKEKELLNEIRKNSKYDRELVFITELGSNLLDELGELKEHHLIKKRTIPLLRLVADPNAKLDVPKTLENMGTVVRSSFENKRAPGYHIRNAFGSAKDLFLSFLKIAPQDLFVPSKYRIIDRERECNEIPKSSEKKEETVGSINPSLLSRPRARLFNKKIKTNQDSPKIFLKRSEPLLQSPAAPYDFSDTFKKIGTVLRESVRSGQEALHHAGEVYHNTRKAFATSRHAAPRVILSSMRIPAVQRPSLLRPRNDKLLVVAPKIVELKQEGVGAPHYSDRINEFVGVEHVLNSLGFANPEAQKVEMRRTVLHPSDFNIQSNTLEERPNSVQNPNLEKLKKYFVLTDTIKQDDSKEDISETLLALENARETVGASNLRDFLVQMKTGFSNLFKHSLDKARENINLKKLKGKVSVESHGKPPTKVKFQFEQPSIKIPKPQKFSPQAVSTLKKNKPDKLFLNKADSSIGKKQVVSDGFHFEKPQTINSPLIKVDSKNITDEVVGAGLLLPRQLLKPFMGQPSKSERRKFFEDYGDSVELDEETKTDSAKPGNQTRVRNKQAVLGAINPIVFNQSDSNYADPAFNYLSGHFREHIKNVTSPRNVTKVLVNDQITETVLNNGTVDNLSNYSMDPIKVTIDSENFTVSGNESSLQNYSLANKRLQKITTESKTVTNITDIPETTTGATSTIYHNETSAEAVKTVNVTNANNTDSVGMKLNKALLTPFMGKLTKKEYIAVDGYDDNSEELQYVGKSNNNKSENFTTHDLYNNSQNLKLPRNAVINDRRNIINNQLEGNVI